MNNPYFLHFGPISNPHFDYLVDQCEFSIPHSNGSSTIFKKGTNIKLFWQPQVIESCSDWNADSTDRDVVARMEAGEDPGAGIETGAGEKDGVPGEEEEMVEDDDESSGDALLDGDDDGHQPKCFLCEVRSQMIRHLFASTVITASSR